MPFRLLLLAMGAFAIGTESFMMAGILPAIAADMGVSVPAAGYLITAFALSYALGSPVLSALLGSVDRKLLLTGSLSFFALANLLAASADSFSILMVSRVLMALGAGLYMPSANAVAVAISPPEKSARAIAVVTGGLTIAVALGVPAGILIEGWGGWRLPFIVVAGLSVVALCGLWIGLPRDLPRGAASLSERFSVICRRDVLLALGTTLTWIAGVYTVYPYLAVLFKETIGATGGILSLLLFIFGVGSAVGNGIGGILSDRFGPVPTLLGVLGVLPLVFLSFAFLDLWPSDLAYPVTALLLFAWGVLGWAVNPSQSSRLVGLAPKAATVALSLNASVLYLGFAVGASLGSLTLSYGGHNLLGVVGGSFQLLALVLVLVARQKVRAAVEAASAA